MVNSYRSLNVQEFDWPKSSITPREQDEKKMAKRSGVDNVRDNLMEKSMKELNETKRVPFNPSSLPLMNLSEESNDLDEIKQNAMVSPMSNPINITDEKDWDLKARKQALNSPSVVDLQSSREDFGHFQSGVMSPKSLTRDSSIANIEKPEVDERKFSFGVAKTEKINYGSLSSHRLNVAQSETFLLEPQKSS